MILNRYERMIAALLLPGKGEGFIFLVAASAVAVALGVAGADHRHERDERLPRRAVRQDRRAERPRIVQAIGRLELAADRRALRKSPESLALPLIEQP
jgi:hypothetical protein